MNKYRIKTKILPDKNQYLKVNIEQNFDVLDILTLSIYGTDAYPNPCGDWGIIVGRIVDSNSFPMENVKVGYIQPLDDTDKNNIIISSIYNGIMGNKYPLLPKYKVNKNHYPIGGFPSEDEVMANSALEYVYKKYFKFVTSTNQNGDYTILGIPLGRGSLLMNFDSTDAGSLSTTPVQQLATGNKDKKNFKKDSKINGTPINANGGNSVTGNTTGQSVSLGNITGLDESGREVIIISGATSTNFGGGKTLKNQNGDNISVIQKQIPNDGINADNTAGVVISRSTNVQIKSFFGDFDKCEIGINRYDYRLEYKYQPCNYIIGTFYSDYNIFNSATPTYTTDNMALTRSKQTMGGKVAFLLDGYDENDPDVSADVDSDGTFYATIPCKWDRYNIDEEGNWYKTNDDFSKNPTGIFTRTPYCLMIYINNNVSVNMGNSKTYSRASSIGFNLNNGSDFIGQIGYDGSTGITTVNRFDINYNAQYYPDSPFPNGYYNPINSNYYPYPKEDAGSKYRNGAELNWDYKNRKSNIYTIASQWTKYGYYSALNVENNGLSGGYGDTLIKGRGAPMPNCYSTKPLSGDTQLITTLTTKGLALPGNQLPLDDDTLNNSAWYPLDLNTELYPNGHIGNITPSSINLSVGRNPQINPGGDFNFNNINPNIGVWGPLSHPTVGGAFTNSVFEIKEGGYYNIKGNFTITGNVNIRYPNYLNYCFTIIKYSNNTNIELINPLKVSLSNNQSLYNGLSYLASINESFYLQEGDLIYFQFYTEGVISRAGMYLENVDINFYKIPTGNLFPLIIGNMYLPTFEATKYDTVYYPVGSGKDIFDTNSGGFNAPRLTEMDLMLYPITDEMFNIVEHTQINNPYENGTINYYFFCNQYWKLRDFIYNEIN
jgi:hypothetical protein